MGWVDLSHTISEGMHRARLSTPPRVRTVSDVEKDGVNLMTYEFGSHLGTHVDAPLHFIRGGASIDELPLDAFIGSGVVLGVKGQSNMAITAEDLDGAGPQPGTADVVLIRTGWETKFGTPEYSHHPYLGHDAVAWLVARGVKLVGLDVVTPDMPEAIRAEGFDWPVHRTLLSRGILIAENLCNMKSLAGRHVEVSGAPIKIKGGDGAPVRMLARATP